jgi:predicted permease
MGFFRDVRYGIRMLCKHPGFTLVAILTLAAGVGVNSTVFTIVNAVFLNGLPFHDPREIMNIRTNRGMSYSDWEDYQRQSRSFRGIGAFAPMAADFSDAESAAERVDGAQISANLFSILGQKPRIGRDFKPEDEKPGATPVALLSDFIWQSRYGGKPGILGQTIRVNLQTYTVVGVMPRGESFPQNTRLWLPLVKDAAHQKRDQRNIDTVGRLAPGVPLKQALTEMKTISTQLTQAYPETNKEIVAEVIPYTERGTGGPIRVVFFSMQGAVGFVLLIACANVANLLLSRAVGRTRETSIRTALGASRWRIVRQLLIESVMMSFAGGVLGLAFAVAGVHWFDAAVTDTGKPYWIVFHMDYHVFLHFLAVCVVTGILFGLAPALQISKSNVNDNLREGGRGTSVGLRARRLTGALLIAEIGLTIVLLVGAGLMIRSFLNMNRFDIGADTNNLMTVQIQPASKRYPQPSDRLAFEERLLQRLGSLPGIESITIASQPPAGGAAPRTLKIDGREIADKDNRLPTVDRIAVVAGYFRFLHTSVSRGRDFNAADGRPGGEVAIVNPSFASKYFPNEDPLGKRIRLGTDFVRGTDDPTAVWATIVGVSPAIFQRPGPNNDLSVQPTVYIPFRQDPSVAFTVIARSALPRDKVISGIRTELRNEDSDLPLYNIRSLEDLLEQQRWPYRVFGTLFAVFALIGLLISAVGVYAVTAHGVGQRTQEIGVRMALGASKQHVLWLVLRQGLRRIAIGLVLGLLAAFGVSRVLRTLLVNITPTDPATFVAITLLLAAVTLFACITPARRATKLDPVEALRTE